MKQSFILNLCTIGLLSNLDIWERERERERERTVGSIDRWKFNYQDYTRQ